MEKQKITVATPYVDRKSKEYEVVPPDPPCRRCGQRLTWVEDEVGNIKRWCMSCSLYGNTIMPG